MATMVREPGEPYRVRYDRVRLDRVANSERCLPPSWIAPSGVDVTDDFIRYARPLIGEDWAPIPLENGLQRFARLQPLFVPKRCRPYVPAAFRRQA